MVATKQNFLQLYRSKFFFRCWPNGLLFNRISFIFIGVMCFFLVFFRCWPNGLLFNIFCLVVCCHIVLLVNKTTIKNRLNITIHQVLLNGVSKSCIPYTRQKLQKLFKKDTKKHKHQRSSLSVVLSSQGKGSVFIKLFVVLTGMVTLWTFVIHAFGRLSYVISDSFLKLCIV